MKRFSIVCLGILLPGFSLPDSSGAAVIYPGTNAFKRSIIQSSTF